MDFFFEEENFTTDFPTQATEINIFEGGITEAKNESSPTIRPEEYIKPVPKLIFIVPYRDRENQYKFFLRHMKFFILEDYSPSDYMILFIHQNDKRTFNRGAMKNIGFIYVKNTYPNVYKNITLVFNDVDIMPINKGIINYETIPGTIKHFYGFNFALGGLFSIKAGDFEYINGFPNYWGWGFEDNLIQKRAINANLTIDRSEFYEVLDKNFIIIFDKDKRISNKTNVYQFLKEVPDGINSIYKLNYSFTFSPERSLDEFSSTSFTQNSFLSDNSSSFFVNVNTFETEFKENKTTEFVYNLRDGNKPFKELVKNPRQIKSKMKMIF